MAAKKSKKAIPTTSGEDEVKGAKRTNIAAGFSADEIEKIDAACKTDLGNVPRGSFVRTAVLRLLEATG
jgi:hypothetical protein